MAAKKRRTFKPVSKRELGNVIKPLISFRKLTGRQNTELGYRVAEARERIEMAKQAEDPTDKTVVQGPRETLEMRMAVDAAKAIIRPVTKRELNEVLCKLNDYIHGLGPKYTEAFSDFARARIIVNQARHPVELRHAVETAKRCMKHWESIAALHGPITREVSEMAASGGRDAESTLGKYRAAEKKRRTRFFKLKEAKGIDIRHLLVPPEKSEALIRVAGTRRTREEKAKRSVDFIKPIAEEIAEKHDLTSIMGKRGKGDVPAQDELMEIMIGEALKNVRSEKCRREIRELLERKRSFPSSKENYAILLEIGKTFEALSEMFARLAANIPTAAHHIARDASERIVAICDV